MHRRLLSLGFGLGVLVMLALSFPACGSDDTSTTPPDTSSQCTDKGGVCAKNFPYLCPPGMEAASGALSTVCGKESPASGDGKEIVYSCCLPATPPADTGGDGDAEAGEDGAGDARDGGEAGDAPDASDATDTASDGADGADASDAKDTSDAG